MQYLQLAWEYKNQIGAAIGSLCLVLLIQARLEISKLNGKLEAYENAPKAEQNQLQSVSGTANAGVKFSIKPKPCPVGKECPPCECPEVVVEANSSAVLVASNEQGQKQGIQAPAPVAKDKLYIGAGIGLYGPILGAPKVNFETPFFYGSQLQVDAYFPPKIYETGIKDEIAASFSLNWGL